MAYNNVALVMTIRTKVVVPAIGLGTAGSTRIIKMVVTTNIVKAAPKGN